MTSGTYQKHCPGCFEDKQCAAVCPNCGYDESAPRGPLFLPHGILLGNKYRVGRVLGKPGGFGVTYLGWDTLLQNRVAIKEFLPKGVVARSTENLSVTVHTEDDRNGFESGRAKFLAEARTLAKFDHPSIVRVRNFFEENGTAYLVMDYYDGMSLSDFMSNVQDPVTPETAIDIILPILDGMAVIHQQNFLHRDIKPQNIYLAIVGRPLLLDFGAARQTDGDHSLSVVVTEGYAPLEQYQRRGAQGPWTDIYALAATLYRMLSGEMPAVALDRIGHDPIDDVSASQLKISEALAAVLKKGMAVRPGERYQSSTEFRDALIAARSAPSDIGVASEQATATTASPNRPPSGVSNDLPDTRIADPETSPLLDQSSAHAGASSPTAESSPTANTAGSNQKTEIPASAQASPEQPASQPMNVPEAAPEATTSQPKSNGFSAWGWGIAALGVLMLIGFLFMGSESETQVATGSKEKKSFVSEKELVAKKLADARAAQQAREKRLREQRKEAEVKAKAAKLFAPAYVEINAGEFDMGDVQGDGLADERPVRHVALPTFGITPTEISIGRFRQFVDDADWAEKMKAGDPCIDARTGKANEALSWESPGYPANEELPVTCISWREAFEYASWLTQSTGQVYRLPTEAEWEYAARAGAATAYWWGPAIKNDGKFDRAVCAECSKKPPSQPSLAVETVKNDLGVSHILGNVREFTCSWYQSLHKDMARNCEGGSPISQRSVRGGSWADKAVDLRVSRRFRTHPLTRRNDTGFRLVRTPN